LNVRVDHLGGGLAPEAGEHHVDGQVGRAAGLGGHVLAGLSAAGFLEGPERERRTALRNDLVEETLCAVVEQKQAGAGAAGAVAADGDAVGVAAEHRDVVAHPLERQYQVHQTHVARHLFRLQVQETYKLLHSFDRT